MFTGKVCERKAESVADKGTDRYPNKNHRTSVIENKVLMTRSPAVKPSRRSIYLSVLLRVHIDGRERLLACKQQSLTDRKKQ